MKKSVLILLLLLPFVAAQYEYDPNIGQMQACSDGDAQCDGNSFQVCVNANWQTTEQCEFGCSSQGCAPPPANQPSENQQPPAEYVRPQVCVGGEKRCDGQKFQLCLNNEWQTQQTCGKTQECTKKGCVSIPIAPPSPVPTLAPEISVKAPLPGPMQKITCRGECAKWNVECLKAADKWFSAADRMKAKLFCDESYAACFDACDRKEREEELGPERVSMPPLKTEEVVEEPVIDKTKEISPEPGVSEPVESMQKITCRGECAKWNGECLKAADKWFSAADRMKAKLFCSEGYAGCLDECARLESELPPETKPILLVEKPKPKGFFAVITDFFKGLFILLVPGEKGGPRENGLTVDLTRWFEEAPPVSKVEIDPVGGVLRVYWLDAEDRKSTRLNSSHRL